MRRTGDFALLPGKMPIYIGPFFDHVRDVSGGKKLTARLHGALAGLLIAHLLVIAALAVSPQLHERIHAGAHDDHHECAVTLFASGACEDSPVPPLVPGFVASEISDSPRPLIARVPSCFLATGILEHAPPSVS